MGSSTLRLSVFLILAFLSATGATGATGATAATTSADWDGSDRAAPVDQPEPADETEAPVRGPHGRHTSRHRHGNSLVNIGHDSTLLADQNADQVVSVFGDARVSGPVRDSVVSVFGKTYVDSKIGGDAVSVAGDVELGPHAEIGGNVVALAGKVVRDPAAIVHGDSETISSGNVGRMHWLQNWVENCLFYGRPLSLAGGLGWAWGLALLLLAFYAGVAIMFRDALTHCVETFEAQPGRSVTAAMITMLLAPVLIVLLCITLIGIAAIPFVVIAFLLASLFGKAVILSWVGRRIMSTGRGAPVLPHPAVTVLVGGVVVLVLYLVPVVGFLVYKLLGFLGFGAVVYTMIVAARARQTAKRGATNAVPPADATAPADAATVETAASISAAAALDAGLPRADFWIRMAALLLDVVLVGFVTSALHAIFHFHLILLAAYGAVMWKLRGSTIGGIVFDLKVVRQDGRPMDWETAIVRALSCFLSLAVVGLGFIWIALDDSRRAWHDKIAGTVVVRVAKKLTPVGGLP